MFDLKVKNLFFDGQRVKSAVDRARRRVLSKAGAFVRRRAKSSIRRRKDPAPPGKPPSSHVGLLRRLIFFSYDPRGDSVVIGPVRRSDSDAPHTLEFGGRVKTRKATRVRVKAGRDKSGRFKKDRIVKVSAGTVMTYRPRPYMGPALKAEEPKLPRMWANSVKGS